MADGGCNKKRVFNKKTTTQKMEVSALSDYTF